VEAADDDDAGGDEVGADGAGGNLVDLAGLSLRSVPQPRHDHGGGKRKAGDDMEEMRAECVDMRVGNARQHPKRAERDRGDGKPAPQLHARQREGCGGDHREIKIERPVARLLGGDQQRRDESAGEAEARQRRPVQQRGGERRQRHQSEQNEGDTRRQEIVERIGGVDGGIGGDGAGGGKHARDMPAGNGGKTGGKTAGDFAAPRPFAGRDQARSEQRAEEDAHAGPEQILLDRVAYEENAAEREREAADPHYPLRAEALFQRRLGRCRRRRWWDRRQRRRRARACFERRRRGIRKRRRRHDALG